MDKEILDLIKTSSNILIITHVNPDGDTLGSASALKSFIERDYKINTDILIQIEDNFNFPKTYTFLPHLSRAKNLSNLEDKYDLVIVVDTASIDRIVNNAREIFNNTKNTILFDHHKTNKGYAKYNLIRGGISSTGEVLYDFFQNNNIKIDENMGIALYAAILTDTGCFKYESTTSHTFKIASEISQIPVNTSEVADLCYTNKPKNMILFQNYAVSNANFVHNDKIAYTLITKEIQEKYNIKDEYTEGIAETLRSISNVEISFVLKETKEGAKASIRTKEIDATIIANKFQGGGHKRAAGCTIKTKINQAAELILKEAIALIE